MVNQVLGSLDQAAVKYQVIDHPPVYTAEEADKYVQGYEFARTKNLFLKNSNGFYLVVIDESKRLDMKQLRQIVHGSRLKFASDADLTKYLGSYAGAVSPMNLINDQDHQVTVIFDQDVIDHHDQIGCHPNTNRQTVILPILGLLKLLKQWGNPVIKVQL